jgi:hypothetical protein
MKKIINIITAWIAIIIAQIIAEAENNEAFNQILIKEGFWGDLGKNVLWAGSRLARGVKRGVGDFFQGAAKGAKSGWSGASWEDRDKTDPSQLEIKNALETLKKAYPQVRDDKTIEGRSIKEWLNQIIEILTKLTTA